MLGCSMRQMGWPDAYIVVVDVLMNARSQLLNAVNFFQMEELRFERSKEALHGCVVQAIAFARHALLNLV